MTLQIVAGPYALKVCWGVLESKETIPLTDKDGTAEVLAKGRLLGRTVFPSYRTQAKVRKENE